jgi:DNA-binding CsgD family transcriptional regulator
MGPILLPWARAGRYGDAVLALVARDAELAAARQAARAGRGAVLVGEAGVGKTALAAAVADEVTAAGGRVVWVVATAAGRLTPFGALAALLPPEMGTVHPALVPHLVTRRLRELAGPAPVLLVVDDAQLLDDHSAAVVLALVTGRVCRTLATVRAEVPASDAVTALWKDRLLERLDLAPLDRAGAHAVLVDRLGGEVASGTVELLWTHSRGNPLYLTELVRFGADTGRLRQDAGVWWWSGDTGLPPRLGELLARRLDELSPAGRDALDLLALGEPLPWDTLAAVVPAEAILEADERGLVTSDERAGLLLVRFAHPLLQAAAEARLTPARRRALGERLRRAPDRHVDLVRRATWEAAAGNPDVDVLLAAADAVLLSDPRAAARFAESALGHDPGPRAAIALAAARAELGEPAAARRALDLAATRVRDADERLRVGFENVSLTLWTERQPERARAHLAALRATDAPLDELDTAEALLTLFSAQPRRALEQADAALARGCGVSARVRALTARMTALTLADEPEAGLAAAEELLAAVDGAAISATRSGMAHAMVAETRLLLRQDADLPRSAGASGRWPTGPAAGPAAGEPAPAWPLLEGVRRHLAGDWPRAVAALREAYVQQRAGEGLFRSEAVTRLVVVLAEAGRPDEAAALLAADPPDGVAVVPGLAPWAAAAVAGGRGRTTLAGELARQAAEVAAEAGAPTSALWYLADAGRWGDPRAAADLADRLGLAARSALSQARLAGIRARADGREALLLQAAEQHLAFGLLGQARELAERAAAGRAGRPGPAVRLAHEARARLGVAAGGPVEDPVGTVLTRREREIARMAAQGLTDREIADALVVSVRTVESHLAAAYRKLGIRSRRELAGLLAAR